MKKFLISTIVAALVAALMGVFVACGDKDDNNGPSDKQLAQTAIATVQTLTDDMVEDETPSSYPVIGQANANKKTYKVTWTVASDFENLANYVSVGEMDAETKQVTINVKKASVEITYTLKATVKVGKASASAEWTKKVPAGQAGEGQIEVTISFVDYETTLARTEFTDEQMVWTQNGITLTNTKGTNGTAITAGSSDKHARLYNGTNVKIEYSGMMVKLVFHSDTSYSYFDQLVDTLNAANLGTVTSNKDNGTATLELTNPTNVIEFPATKQMRLTALDVVANAAALTDADKVAGAKAALDLANKNYTAAGTYDLPAEKNGATVTWALKEGTTSDYVEIEGGNKLKVKSMPTADTEVKLTATLTLNNETDTKDFTITLVPLGLENDGTEAHPYTPAEAWNVAKTLTANSADEVYVKGFVVLPGTYSGSQYNNFDNMYIGDTYDSTKTYSYADYTNGEYGGIFYIYRPKAEGDYLTKDGLNAGDEVTFKGYLTNYKGTSPQLANGGVCVARKAVERTDEQIVAAAKPLVTLSKDTFTAKDENITLDATKKDANLEWKIKNGEELVTENEYVKIADGKLTILSLPTTDDVTVTITVTIKSGEETDTKDFTITVKVPEEIDDSAFVLLPSALKVEGSQSYANYKGDHTVGTYTVNFSDAMVAKPNGYPDDTIQLKASAGVMKLTGNFTKIVIKFVSTYDYGATFNNVTVKAGGNELTATHKGSVATGEKNSSGYEYKIHTFEYTVTGGNQEIEISKTNAGAANFESITFTLADDTTGGDEGEETETQTLSLPEAIVDEQ